MKHLLFVPFMFFCLTAVGQVTYPYNPDGNADGDIAVGDLQDFLANYGNPFLPSEIMVGDSMALSEWIPYVSSLINGKQQIIDSLLLEYSNLSDLMAMEAYLDSAGVCAVNYDEVSGHHYIPSYCRFVNIVTGYYPDISTEAALRLPEHGLFEGQIIEFTLNARTFLSPGTINIEAIQEDSWAQVGSLSSSGCLTATCLGQYNTSIATNARLVWGGSEWSLTEYLPHLISWE